MTSWSVSFYFILDEWHACAGQFRILQNRVQCMIQEKMSSSNSKNFLESVLLWVWVSRRKALDLSKRRRWIWWNATKTIWWGNIFWCHFRPSPFSLDNTLKYSYKRFPTCPYHILYDTYLIRLRKVGKIFKGTQAWEFFGLWFWNLYFFVVSYA